MLRVVPLGTNLDDGNKGFENKCRMNVSSWRRIAPDALPPQNKAFSNYMNSRLGEMEAERLGFDQCLFLDSRGFVSEGGGACIMGVRNDVLMTPPVTASILDGITRESLMVIAKEDIGLKVEERDLTRADLYGMDEVFLCGTWEEVRPISSIDDIEIGNEYPGPVTKKLAKCYASVVSGNTPRRAAWLTPLSSS
jgi:branched-chain amino acid aminotransferase